MAFIIEDELRKLPASPGVYIMHDKKDDILYVGKAVSLKNRVRQYFQSSRGKSTKIMQMVSKIHRFEYIVTDSELEALVLENNLIKEHRPRYNTMLKDDKTYPYIKFTVSEDYPRIMLTRKLKKDKAKYFGPFTSSTAVNNTLDFLRKTFRIRNCSRNLPKDIRKQRACLDYYIHQCDAPCQGFVSKDDYNKQVSLALEFLNGNYKKLTDEIQKQMNEASQQFKYEEAAQLRDLLNSLLHVTQKQKISSESMEDRDIIALAKDEEDVLVQIFFIRDGKMVGREHHYVQVSIDDENPYILESFVKQFYAGTPFLPKELWLQYALPDEELISNWLSQKRRTKVRLLVPKKGNKEKMIELAYKNAELILSRDKEKLRREQLKTTGALNEIEKLLGISNIKRIESFDISNISGAQSVGSMVVYEDGKPKRNDYRKFKIKNVSGPDDYASMREVLYRRFTHESRYSKTDSGFAVLPDLIMMDGGKGQVGAALEVLEELGMELPVCGMVKDDKHRTDRLYFKGSELELKTRTEAFKLITRIQDEVHRFAIEYHRSLRSKTQVKSILDDINGIGAVRRKALMKHFKDIESIKNADLSELKEVSGMDSKSAQSVYDFFRK
ncbi:excinuclease ABC subunit UvrC [Johnsonella ignava]|uniref:excinuclease ABC subunit UvrC n=1 Tax=Johnsonella ignava TaxID=43995 RepID=UPI0023F54CCD|nr:excinuclease ABC subunit UvrC [Johnsonella ignava]